MSTFLPFQLSQQALAAFEDIAPGGFEIAGVPRVCHIADTVCEVKEFMDLLLWVAASDSHYIFRIINRGYFRVLTSNSLRI